MSKAGFIKSYRRIFEHPLLAKDHAARHLFSDLMHFAAWDTTIQDWRGTPIAIKRGQLMMSLRVMEATFGVSLQSVRTILRKLDSHGIVKINTLPNKGPIVVTICNWDKYQAYQHSANTPANTEPTQSQHTKEEREEREEVKTPPYPPTGGADELPLGKQAGEAQPSASKPKRSRSSLPAYTADFEAVWSAYPKTGNGSKLEAFRVWLALSDADRASVPRAVAIYAAQPERQRYTHNLRTWLNQRHFETILEKAAATPAGKAASSEGDRYVAALAEMERRSDAEWRDSLARFANGFWPAGELGPPPCSKLCKVPRHLIDELGLVDKYDPAGRAINLHHPNHPANRQHVEA